MNEIVNDVVVETIGIFGKVLITEETLPKI